MARKAQKKTGKNRQAKPKTERKPRVRWPFPRVALEEAVRIPVILKEKNGGNPWSPEEIASALSMSKATTNFFYTAAASRDFGFTEGGRDSDKIALTDFGRDVVYAPGPDVELRWKRKAFQSIELFSKVLDYYKGSKLPEMRYLSNTLTREFGLAPETHDEFSRLFKENCDYLGIGEGIERETEGPKEGAGAEPSAPAERREVVTLAEPESETGLKCFVIMPFRERDENRPPGFFDEVLRNLIAPAGRQAGFTVSTANRQGSDVIQSTIINDLLDADLVVADLTEHNPNVLFELGVRMAHDKPVALIRAKGTGPVFDIDNMLRVVDYDANLWASTVQRDVPRLKAHIEATWTNRQSDKSYMKLLRRAAPAGVEPA
jgi:hypothetical protein